MLKVQAIMHDGSVGLELMTDDPSEAEEMRTQCLAFDCVAEVKVLDEPGWVKVEACQFPLPNSGWSWQDANA